MPNFWDSINQNNNANNTNKNNNFNIQDFFKFAQEMNGKDVNSMLQQIVNSGQYTNDQIENAKSQAKGIYQMLKGMGFVK